MSSPPTLQDLQQPNPSQQRSPFSSAAFWDLCTGSNARWFLVSLLFFVLLIAQRQYYVGRLRVHSHAPLPAALIHRSLDGAMQKNAPLNNALPNESVVTEREKDAAPGILLEPNRNRSSSEQPTQVGVGSLAPNHQPTVIINHPTTEAFHSPQGAGGLGVRDQERIWRYLVRSHVLFGDLQSGMYHQPPSGATKSSPILPTHFQAQGSVDILPLNKTVIMRKNGALNPNNTVFPEGLLMCVRPWLFDFLFKMEILGLPLPPRHKMGELRTWSAILRSLFDLGCTVELSAECGGLATRAKNARAFSVWTGPYAKDQQVREESIPSASEQHYPVGLLLVEDLWLDVLRHTKFRARCIEASQTTVAVAGDASVFIRRSKTMTLYATPDVPMSVGLVATCREVPDFPTKKKWYGLLWGKHKQQGSKVLGAVQAIQKYVPLVSSCMSHCAPSLPSLNLRNLTKVEVDRLLGSALFMVGIVAPRLGATVPEALACGTVLIARTQNVGMEFANHAFVRRFKHWSEVEALVVGVLRAAGFDFSRSFDDQPKDPRMVVAHHHAPPYNGGSSSSPPSTVRSSLYRDVGLLPFRYSLDGHREHIAKLFGMDAVCRAAAVEPNNDTLMMNVASPQVSLRQSPVGRSLYAPWAWPGCDSMRI